MSRSIFLRSLDRSHSVSALAESLRSGWASRPRLWLRSRGRRDAWGKDSKPAQSKGRESSEAGRALWSNQSPFSHTVLRGQDATGYLDSLRLDSHGLGRSLHAIGSRVSWSPSGSRFQDDPACRLGSSPFLASRDPSLRTRKHIARDLVAILPRVLPEPSMVPLPSPSQRWGRLLPGGR